jgi:hypothetical protein
MKTENKMSKTKLSILAATLLTIAGAGFSGAAMAQQGPYNNGYNGAYMRPAAIVITEGWHQDRYWDGHRYWARRDWERRHHEPEHNDHRGSHRY